MSQASNWVKELVEHRSKVRTCTVKAWANERGGGGLTLLDLDTGQKLTVSIPPDEWGPLMQGIAWSMRTGSHEEEENR